MIARTPSSGRESLLSQNHFTRVEEAQNLGSRESDATVLPEQHTPGVDLIVARVDQVPKRLLTRRDRALELARPPQRQICVLARDIVVVVPGQIRPVDRSTRN